MLWLLTELKLLFFTQSNFPFIALFTDEKRGKSHIRGVSPVSATPTNALRALVNSPRARVSRTSHAWRVCAARGKVKVGSFVILHSFSYTTRANISHEKAEQIRARIVCTPAESAGIDRFAKQTRSASPRRGIVNKVSALMGLSKYPTSCYVRTQTRTQSRTARFAIA